MEAILKYDLPEDKDEFTLATKGNEFWNCLWDLDQECRGNEKYGYDKNRFKTPDDVFSWVRDFILDNADIHCVE